MLAKLFLEVYIYPTNIELLDLAIQFEFRTIIVIARSN